MSVEQFVSNTRSAIASLVGAGAISATQDTTKRFQALHKQAQGLGLMQLAKELEVLMQWLEQRGSLGFEPSVPLANTMLEIIDRIEALSSTLTLWSIEEKLMATSIAINKEVSTESDTDDFNSDNEDN